MSKSSTNVHWEDLGERGRTYHKVNLGIEYSAKHQRSAVKRTVHKLAARFHHPNQPGHPAGMNQLHYVLSCPTYTVSPHLANCKTWDESSKLSCPINTIVTLNQYLSMQSVYINSKLIRFRAFIYIDDHSLIDDRSHPATGHKYGTSCSSES